MSKSEDAGKYQVDNDGPVQGQVIGDHNKVELHFHSNGDKEASSTKPEQPWNVPATPSLSSIQRQNRERLLKRVRAIWIEGLLEQSLHQAALIDLHLQEQPDALENPWRLEVQELDHAPRPLPIGTSIVEVYDKADGELLILGEPGGGKTTLLLELTRILLERAEKDEQLPMPIVFNLPSWAEKRQSLRAWLVEELRTKYQVSHKIGADWIDTDRILPLLDGLDEVAKEVRSACIEQINIYHRSRLERGSSPMVVCCRSEEYAVLSTHVRFQRAVSILPLTDEQINIYLGWIGEQVKALRQVLNDDLELYNLARKPLMLNIFTLAYQGVTAAEITTEKTPETMQRTIFARYVKKMIKRRGISNRWKPEQVIRWLAILAQQMQRQNQSVFYLERMQADWLDSEQNEIYRQIAVRMISMLIGVLVTWIVALLFSNPFDLKGVIRPGLIAAFFGFIFAQNNLLPKIKGAAFKWRSSWKSALDGALLVGLGTALVWGYTSDRGIFSLSENVLFGRFVAGFTTTCACLLAGLLIYGMARLGKRSRYWYALLVGLATCFLFAIRSDWAYWWYYQKTNAGSFYGLTFALNEGSLYGFTAILLSIILHKQDGTVRPTEIIIWSLQSLKQSLREERHLRNTLFIALLLGLLRGLSVLIGFGRPYDNIALLFAAITQPPIINESMISGIIFGLSLGLSYWLVLGLWNGVSQGVLDNPRRLLPNQGMRQSARNGLRMGLLAGCIGMLVIILATVFTSKIINNDIDLSYLLYIGWNAALTSGLLGGLLTGSLAWLQHYILRMLLWWTKLIPSDYIDFLDYAADRILLHKVGGGYIFIHRLLLEYFTTLDKSASTESTFPASKV